MRPSFLGLYSDGDLVRMVRRETGSDVSGRFIREFRRWVGKKGISNGSMKMSTDFHVWLICKVHEFFRIEKGVPS